MKRLLSFWPDGPVAAGVLLCAACVLAFAPDHFLTMLVRAFLWQWSLGFAAIAVWNLPSRRWWSVGAAALGGLLTLWPPLNASRNAETGRGVPVLRVAQMNLLKPNTAHAEVLQAALAANADVISFQEVSPEWAKVLEEGLRARYPFHREMPGSNCYGIAMYSRVPFDRAEVRWLASNPVVDAVVRTSQGPVRVVSVHASSPGDHAGFVERNAQLNELMSWLEPADAPTIVVGDLNTVSWDRAFRRLCDRADLREHPDGTQATWPSFAGLALIPLDHVLVNDRLCVADVSTFPITGSDHRGVVADITSLQ